MIFTEDLGKTLELCLLHQKKAGDKLRFWCREIDQRSLSEREAYKKKAEVLLLSSFLYYYPDTEIENLTDESPDFIVTINGRRIGLEISEVINHFELKKREVMVNQLFRNVEILLNQKNTEPGIYYIGINSDFLDIMNDSKIIKDICTAIINQKNTKYITSIRRTPYYKGVLLVLDYSMSLFDELKAEKILNIIEKKNEKYPLYTQKIDECWLILVSNMHNIASRYSYIQTPEILQFIKSPFQRILHLENLYSEMLMIK